MLNDIKNEDLKLLWKGKVPDDDEVLRSLTVGTQELTGFLTDQYLKTYIPEGGSKIKMLTGRPGAGKTHVSRLIQMEAKAAGFLTVRFSAKEVWLHDFREIYLEILRQCDLERILSGCAKQMIREMGYDPSKVGDDKTFMDYLSETGEGDVLSRGEIRRLLREYFTKNPLLDNNFAGCCSLLTGSMLGHPVLEASQKEMIYSFVHGDKSIKLSQLRSLGLSPSRITKYNARHLLRSLAVVSHLGGFAGIVVVIDDMEVLQKKGTADPIHYAKVRREDAYESIRQLIDDIDSMHYLMFVLCFDRSLMDNEDYGMKSYQALWMRVQNEVTGPRFNAFADIIDLDRYADKVYTPKVLCEMAQRICSLAGIETGSDGAFDEATAAGLIEQSQYGGLGLPYLVNRYLFEHEDVKGGGTDVGL